MAIELSEAVKALEGEFGARLVDSQDGGRHQMEKALRKRFDLDKGAAKELIKALEDDHSIRWRTGHEGQSTVPHTAPPFAEAVGAENMGGGRHFLTGCVYASVFDC